MFVVKFKELKDWDKFIYKHNQYIKIPERQVLIVSCCNFTRKAPVNAQKSDKTCVWFDEDEEVVLNLN